MPTKKLVLSSLFAALIAVGAWISIPTAVPFTLQTLMIFLALGLLGGKYGTVSVALYIALGAFGLPVFSGFKSGVSALLGSTGGYIIGFLLASLLYWLITRAFGEKTLVMALAMTAGLLLCYIFGTLWFATVYSATTGQVSLLTVLSWCVFPFVLPDAAKIALAVFLSLKLKRYLKLLQE